MGSQDGETHDIIVDHSSFSWGFDENWEAWYPIENVTIQWSITSEGLMHASHHYTQENPLVAHSKGLIARDSVNFDLHHNLFALNDERNPLLVACEGGARVINNVVYQWRSAATVPRGGNVDVISNAYIYGPNTRHERRPIQIGHFESDDEYMALSLYYADNVALRHQDTLDTGHGETLTSWDDMVGTLDGAGQFSQPPADASEFRRLEPLPAAPVPITIDSALAVEDVVLEHVGASLVRDAVDLRIVDHVRNGTGDFIDLPSDAGGWPTLETGTPPVDQDHDGMPDTWEEAHGLDPSSASDGPGDLDGDGYTNVEGYLNSLVARD
ncbi:hypothetical protein [Microbacterium sp.]